MTEKAAIKKLSQVDKLLEQRNECDRMIESLCDQLKGLRFYVCEEDMRIHVVRDH